MGTKNDPWSVVGDEEGVTVETNHNPQQAVILVPAPSGQFETGVR